MEVGRKWLDPEGILKVDKAVFAEDFMWGIKERERSQGGIELLFTEMLVSWFGEGQED